MTILCTIDLLTREVFLPADQRIAAYDHNVDVIHFQAEPVEDFSFDLSSIRIAAKGPNKARHDYPVDPSTVQIEEETGYITFDWPIPQGVTEMPEDMFGYGATGQLIFAVCAEIISGSTLSKAWHSDDGIITVVAHLEPESGGGEDPEEEATNRQMIGQLQTDVAVVQREVAAVAGGVPTVVDSISDMTDTGLIYILSSDGYWYYYDGAQWTQGGFYGGAVTSTTFTEHGVPADDFAVGQALAEKADADDVGDLSQLTTTAKDNLVAAINEAAQTGSSGKVTHELPVLKIYGDISASNKETETKAYRYVWENPDEGEQRTGYCSLKWQGESSLTYPKKNYTIKFFHDKKYKRKDKISLFDELVLKKNKWVIKANWVDRSQAKNVVSCRLWGQMVKSRITEPESHMKAAPNFGAVDGYPVKVYVNDEWHGLYSFNIPKDEDLFGMEEDNPLHCAVCGDDQLSDAVKFRKASTNGWELEVPDAWASYEVEEEGQTVTKYVADGFTSMINFVMTATDEEFKSGLDDYLDVESAIDYYLFAYYACAIDSLGRNLMLVTYDGGNKWYCSLYDADTTWGNGLSGGGAYNPQLPCPEMYECPSSLLWERMEACFGDELWERWSDLRQTVFDPDYIKNEFSLFWRYITDEDYQADIDRWTNVDPSRPFVPQWNVNIRKAIPDFIEERVVYCDAQIKAMRTPVPCTGITLDQSSIAFATGDPITLTATVEPENTTDDIVWTVSDSTILTVEDGVVRPLKNGTATITATCGTQTATCTATVTALSYSVTLTGAHAHLSNTSDVQPNASYTGTLTTDTGYSLTFVSVSMGGVDITETAYNNGVITIAQVTGNISVAVDTVYEYDTTDLVYRLPAEFNVDGQHYIDTLWQYDGVSSFTVALDLTQPEDVVTNGTGLLGALLAAGYNFRYDPAYRGFRNILNQNMMSGLPAVTGDRAKIVLRYDSTRHVLSCRSWSRYNSIQYPDRTGESTSSYGHVTVTGQANRDAFTQTLYLGAIHTASGAEYSQDSGTFHDCRIYDRRWTDAEVMEWLGVDSLSTVFTDDMDA